MSYPPNRFFLKYQGMLIYLVEKILFESCIFLSRLATHGNTNQKYIETLANLDSINQSSTSLGQRKKLLTLALDYRSISFWFFGDRINAIIEFDVFW